MNRYHFLAAELFSYSFDNYAQHLGIGNLRFEQLMPDAARNLERAVKEGWSDGQVAQVLDCAVADVPEWRKRYQDAVEVVDARSPAEGFRNAVRQSLAAELAQRQLADAELESAVQQVCYRVADLSFVLQRRKEELSNYSEELREEMD